MAYIWYMIGVLGCVTCWRVFGAIDKSRTQRANYAANRSKSLFGSKPVRHIGRSLAAMNVAILIALINGWTIIFWRIIEKHPTFVSLGKNVVLIAIGTMFSGYFLALFIAKDKQI